MSCHLGYARTVPCRRAEPFGETFLRDALRRLFAADVAGVRDTYLATLDALRRRELPTYDVSSRVRLTKSPAKYAETRESRREFAYEALLASGRTHWRVGDRVRVYRTRTGTGAVAPSPDDAVAGSSDPRDYDVDHYARVLRDNFAVRLARALTPADFAAVFADANQLSLFAPSTTEMRPVLNSRPGLTGAEDAMAGAPAIAS